MQLQASLIRAATLHFDHNPAPLGNNGNDRWVYCATSRYVTTLIDDNANIVNVNTSGVLY